MSRTPKIPATRAQQVVAAPVLGTSAYFATKLDDLLDRMAAEVTDESVAAWALDVTAEIGVPLAAVVLAWTFVRVRRRVAKLSLLADSDPELYSETPR